MTKWAISLRLPSGHRRPELGRTGDHSNVTNRVGGYLDELARW